ncbi:MAG: spermidine synthase [Planctomycetota bacterium]
MAKPENEPQLSRSVSKMQSIVLKIVVFLAGAVLMGFEIVGSRVLAPRFGNDIFVWGSLIGIFLAALSLGYFLGGFAADKWPRHEMLAVLLAFAGILLILTPSYAGKLAVVISKARFGPRLGPLMACILIFAFPSILMGMVSPWAIRLETRVVARSGRVAGVLYAISTLGSIVGTFATAFFLIGLFKVSNIIRILGGVLIFAAALQMVTALKIKPGIHAILFIAAGIGLYFLPDAVSVELERPQKDEYGNIKIIDRKILEEDSTYNHIAVVERSPGGRSDHFSIFGYEECKRYYLWFDNYWESAIFDLPERNYPSACRYTDLLHFPFVCADEPKKIKTVCVVGGGGGVVPRQYLTDYRWIERVDLIEIDSRVVEIAEEYFHLYDYPGHNLENPKLVTHVADGREFFRRNPDTKYDLIILDAFGLGGRIPFHLLTKEYLEEISSHLNPDGMVGVNIISSLEGSKSRFYKAVARTFEAVFPTGVYVFPRYYYVDWYMYKKNRNRLLAFNRKNTMNIILVAMTSGKLRSRRVLEERLAERRGEGWLTGPYNLDHHMRQYLAPEVRDIEADIPVLTDEFAPVESLRY